MNQTQQKYFFKRLLKMQEVKYNTLSTKHTKKGKGLTDEERHKLIKTGKVKLRKVYDTIGSTYSSSNMNLNRFFDFSKYESKSSTNFEALKKDKAKIVAAFDEARDELMLGGQDNALKLIKKLEKM